MCHLGHGCHLHPWLLRTTKIDAASSTCARSVWWTEHSSRVYMAGIRPAGRHDPIHTLTSGHLAQQPPHDLARSRLGQRGRQVDGFRHCKRPDRAPHLQRVSVQNHINCVKLLAVCTLTGQHAAGIGCHNQYDRRMTQPAITHRVTQGCLQGCSCRVVGSWGFSATCHHKCHNGLPFQRVVHTAG
jgi:hypothetical protein